MVMPANSRLLAEAIPGAELLEGPGAGHLYVTDAPELDRAVLDFLSARSSPGPSAPAPR
jgi:pimeloyl-ACP methyl ester carboxylesterase